MNPRRSVEDGGGVEEEEENESKVGPWRGVDQVAEAKEGVSNVVAAFSIGRLNFCWKGEVCGVRV